MPTMQTRLPTLPEIQREKVAEVENNPTENPLIFKPYNFGNESSITSIPRISLTQQPITDQGVNVPEIYISDLININPNSIANVEKVLLHIETITSIRNGTQKWIAVVCDGVPYHHTMKIKEKFPWLVLILGQLHEEMNMLRAFVELN